MAKKRIKKKQKLYILVGLILVLSIFIGTITYKVKQEVKSTGNLSEPVKEEYSFLLNENSILLNDNNFVTNYDNLNQTIQNNFNNGSYTINNPYVIKNPYNMNPNNVLILFKTNKEESITITLKGKNDDDIVTTYASSYDHIIPIYNLYNNYKNEITIASESESNTITIDVSNDNLYNINNIENSLSNNSYYLVNTLDNILLYDNYGNQRTDLKITNKDMTLMDNNHLLVLTNDKVDYLEEIDLFGYIYKKIELDIEVSHIKYINNHIFLYDNDNVYELSLETGSVTKLINTYELLRMINPNIIENSNNDLKDLSIYNNELYLVLNNSVLNINLETKSINYILGSNKHWNYLYKNYLIKGNNYSFTYPLGITSIYINEDGSITTYNTNYNSYTINNAYITTYNVDRDKRVAYIINKKEYNYQNINTYMNNKIITLVNNNVSNIYELDDNYQQVYGITLETNINNTYKYNIDNNYYEFIKPTFITNNASEYEILSSDKSMEYADYIPKSYTMSLENNRLFILTNDDIEYVTLISTRGNAYKYKFDKDKKYITIGNQISGKYYIFLSNKDYIYNTINYLNL